MELKDWLGENNQIGQDIMKQKYLHNNETLDQWFKRVSGGDLEVEKLIKEKKFLFGGRVLANRGIEGSGNFYNCFSRGYIPDDYSDIMDALKEVGITFKIQGGQGISLSKLRPKGTPIGENYESDGIMPFIEMFNCVTQGTSQGGSRKGALLIGLDVRHKEAENFITLKTNVDAITKANLSLEIDDEFMTAVQEYYINNKTIVLHEKREYSGHIIEYDIVPINLYKKMMEIVWDYGEPGCVFVERFKNYNFLEYDDNYNIEICNPCVTGDTLIQTVKGNIPIKELVGNSIDVYCMDNNGNLTIGTATKIWKTRENAETVTIVTPKGNLICTPDHKVYTINKGWVKAQDLHKGDKIKGLNRSMCDETHTEVCLSGGKYIREHRFVMGHYFDITNKDIHHKDGNTFNNSFDNLEILEHGEHSRITNTNRHIEVQRDKVGKYINKKIHSKRKTLNQNKKVGSNWFVQEIIYNDKHEDVYDMTVEKYHNFIANDMVVHNCGEQPLKAKTCCNLGSLNLYEFVDNKFTKDASFNYNQFYEAIKIASNALDDIIDENAERLPKELYEYKQNAKDWRNIGLGVFGYADMLMALGLKYGSQEAIEFTNNLFDKMMIHSIYANEARGYAKGSFPLCDAKKIRQSEIYKNHMQDFELTRFRNCTLLSIAPTGSIGTMMGLSGGIEPEFALSYIRRTDNLKESYKIEAKVVSDYRNATHNNGELPDYFVTSSQIPWKERIDTQAIIQRHIDTAISSTVNLPKDTTKESIENLYLYAWSSGLKGITIYRSGCKREGILTTESKSDKDTPKPSELSVSKQFMLGRGDILDVCDDLISYKRTIQSGCGKFYVHLDFDDMICEPLETWLDTGSDGTCERNLQLISRLMSLCLRGGIPIESIIDQCKSIKPCPSYVRRQCKFGDCSKGSSCPNAIGFALEELYDKIKDRYFSDDADVNDYTDEDWEVIETIEKEKDNLEVAKCDNKTEQDWIDEGKCPICHEPFEHEGGCVICKNDGWSKCS